MSDLGSRYTSGYVYYDETTDFSLSLAGFSPIEMDKAMKRYEHAFTAAFDMIDRIEAGEIVNHTAVEAESEDRKVDHYNLRMKKEVDGNSLSKSLALWEQVKARAEELIASGEYKHVIFNGIGGSYLGPYFLLTGIHGEDYNLTQMRHGRPTLHFIANTDADSFHKVMSELDLSKTIMVAISKSGSTAETRTNLLTFIDQLKLKGLTPGRHLMAVTTPGSKLDRMANDMDFLSTFNMNVETGGRTSIGSAVSMVPCAFADLDFAGFLEGMSAMDETTRRRDARQNPAALISMAIDWYFRLSGVQKNMILLGYNDSLKQLAHYCQQLYMESLGKEYNVRGLPARTGLTVFGGVGTGEQHAFLQQIQKGVSDCFVRFVRCRKRDADYPDQGAGSMGRQLLAFLKGTETALVGNDRIWITEETPDASMRSLGLMVALEERVVTILAAFWEINAYDQPGVQDGKLAALAVNRISLALEKAIAAGPALVEGASADVLAALGLTEVDGVDPDHLAWLADSILSDMEANVGLAGSYPLLTDSVTVTRRWDGVKFLYTIQKQ
eukprot:gnl/Dysnectes_brevis/750_a823_4315.p1 GENE.gnl/Dysnectes_brevis/750_a823_4315~~gnl/Dysnectes_brevis/750_a823_4315.p1  ORF type:complete len:563 (+),score=199.68 gnl/Dysnectes_brevis/750_a823_4315:30-1691(+)